jgi:hypothetical protein
VNVLYGSPNGLTAAGDQFFTMDSQGVAALTGGAQSDARFGASLAAGDFNGDGFSDLAISAPFATVQGVARAGLVFVIYGSANGLSGRSASNAVFTGQPPLDGAVFGRSLVWADFGRGPQGDLAVGAPGATFGPGGEHIAAGEVHVLYGTTAGLSNTGRQLFREGLNGLLGAPSDFDGLGTTLAAANFGNGVTADLAVGAPDEGPSGLPDGTGTVRVIYGTPTGLTTTANQLINGVATGEQFGGALAGADFGRSAEADLAVGAPRHAQATAGGTVAEAGSVAVFYGSSFGLAGTPGQVLTENDAATDGPETNDLFGATLAANDFDGNRTADLAVGAPFETIEAGTTHIGSAGAVVVFYGGSTGLNDPAALAPIFLHQRVKGTQGSFPVAGESDNFGASLSAWNFGKSAQADLAIGVPRENVDKGVVGGFPLVAGEAGSVNVVYGSASGLVTNVVQEWTQDTPDVEDGAETGDHFGGGLY